MVILGPVAAETHRGRSSGAGISLVSVGARHIGNSRLWADRVPMVRGLPVDSGARSGVARVHDLDRDDRVGAIAVRDTLAQRRSCRCGRRPDVDGGYDCRTSSGRTGGSGRGVVTSGLLRNLLDGTMVGATLSL